MWVLAGIPLLIWDLIKSTGAQLAAVAATIARIGIINGLFIIATLALLAGFSVLMDTWFTSALNALSSFQLGSLTRMILPSDTGVIVGIAVAADSARWVHDWGQRLVNRKFSN